jgi:HPt (histidine-containing phosphotransfer) domain-containing protein
MKTDLTYLKNMSGGAFEIMKEMIDLFIEQVAEISEEMNAAYDRKDWIILGKLAHKAKSSVSIMGMDGLAVSLKNLELSAAEGKDIESYKAIIDKFMGECSEAVVELTNYLEEAK